MILPPIVPQYLSYDEPYYFPGSIRLVGNLKVTVDVSKYLDVMRTMYAVRLTGLSDQEVIIEWATVNWAYITDENGNPI